MQKQKTEEEPIKLSSRSFEVWLEITWRAVLYTLIPGALIAVVLLFITSLGETNSFADYLDWAGKGAFYGAIVGVFTGFSQWRDLAEQSFDSLADFLTLYHAGELELNRDTDGSDDDQDDMDFDM